MSTVPAQPGSQTPHVIVTAAPGKPTWQSILAAIMAAFQAVEPIIIHIVPPKVAEGIQIGETLEPIVVQTVVAVQQGGQ